MGSVEYYFKAVFQNVKEAELGYKAIKKYLEEHGKAEQEWQKLRNDSGLGTPAERYKLLSQKYPLAFIMFPEKLEVDKSMNELAGKLIAFDSEDESEITLDGNNVLVMCYVWQFDEWEHLVEFANLLGAWAGYISDEYINKEQYFNLINASSKPKEDKKKLAEINKLVLLNSLVK